ncbi:MAG TPA: PAS domain S-box protein [Flavobacterium sp.]|jgi:PAS domain S-box-containing protein
MDPNPLPQVLNNERNIHTMLMSSPFAMSITTGNELKIVFANDVMKKYWGKGQDIEGKTLHELLPELDSQPFPEIMRSVLSTGLPVSINEKRVETVRNGISEINYYNIVYQPYYEEDKIAGVTTIAFDVSEQVTARQMIEESEAHFRKLADLMPTKITNSDPHGNLIYCNQHWLDYSGLTFEELRDYGYHKIIHPEELEHYKELLRDSTASVATISTEMRFRNKDGQYKWHLKLASPIIGDDGQVKLWIASTTEIDHQINQKEILERSVRDRTAELEEANNRLKIHNEEKVKHTADLTRANKELLAFNYVSGHDLQEPLRKVQTFADRILSNEKDKLSEKGQQDLLRILSSTAKMRNLIDDLLAYSKITLTDQLFVETDLNIILNEVTKEFARQIEERNVTINISGLHEMKIIPFQFIQLFQNLISNCLKFERPDMPLVITISSTLENVKFIEDNGMLPNLNYFRINFADNGIGFDPQYKERVFNVFERVHDNKELSGTGIGLAIVKKIVDNHKGFIIVDSELGQGSTFSMYFPR